MNLISRVRHEALEVRGLILYFSFSLLPCCLLPSRSSISSIPSYHHHPSLCHTPGSLTRVYCLHQSSLKRVLPTFAKMSPTRSPRLISLTSNHRPPPFLCFILLYGTCHHLLRHDFTLITASPVPAPNRKEAPESALVCSVHCCSLKACYSTWRTPTLTKYVLNKLVTQSFNTALPHRGQLGDTCLFVLSNYVFISSGKSQGFFTDGASRA